MKNDSLSPSRVQKLITRSPEFQAALPRQSPESMSPAERRNSARRAVAMGGAALALRLEKEQGAYSLDAALTTMISELDEFYFSNKRIEAFTEYAAQNSRRGISQAEQDRNDGDKLKVSKFNHALTEVINASRGQFSFDELLTFMTQQHIALGGHNTQEEFHVMAREHLIGMRNEVAVEQVLISEGVEFELGTEEQDLEGGDFIIEDVLIDFKASIQTAERAKATARRRGFNPDTILWSHIKFEDFRGGLTLPAEHNKRIARQLLPDIQQAIASEKRQQRRA